MDGNQYLQTLWKAGSLTAYTQVIKIFIYLKRNSVSVAKSLPGCVRQVCQSLFPVIQESSFSLLPYSWKLYTIHQHFLTELQVSIQLHPDNEDNFLSLIDVRKKRKSAEVSVSMDRCRQTTVWEFIPWALLSLVSETKDWTGKDNCSPPLRSTAEAGWNHGLLVLTMPVQLINSFEDIGPPVLWQPK